SKETDMKRLALPALGIALSCFTPPSHAQSRYIDAEHISTMDCDQVDARLAEINPQLKPLQDQIARDQKELSDTRNPTPAIIQADLLNAARQLEAEHARIVQKLKLQLPANWKAGQPDNDFVKAVQNSSDPDAKALYSAYLFSVLTHAFWDEMNDER